MTNNIATPSDFAALTVKEAIRTITQALNDPTTATDFHIRLAAWLAQHHLTLNSVIPTQPNRDVEAFWVHVAEWAANNAVLLNHPSTAIANARASAAIAATYMADVKGHLAAALAAQPSNRLGNLVDGTLTPSNMVGRTVHQMATNVRDQHRDHFDSRPDEALHDFAPLN